MPGHGLDPDETRLGVAGRLDGQPVDLGEVLGDQDVGGGAGGADAPVVEQYDLVGDRSRLAERAAELMRRAPGIQPLTRYRLADMQAATLALYQDLAAARSPVA